MLTTLALTVDPGADVKDGDTWNFFIVLAVRGGQGEQKILKWNFAEMPLSWDMKPLCQKIEKTEISPKVAGLSPLSTYITKKLLQDQFIEK